MTLSFDTRASCVAFVKSASSFNLAQGKRLLAHADALLERPGEAERFLHTGIAWTLRELRRSPACSGIVAKWQSKVGAFKLTAEAFKQMQMVGGKRKR